MRGLIEGAWQDACRPGQCYSDHSRRLLRVYRLEKLPVYAGSASNACRECCVRGECCLRVSFQLLLEIAHSYVRLCWAQHLAVCGNR
jgi:hypothetical protein